MRWIVGDPPAGATDIAARLIGQWLSDRLGQPFVIENRPGASGNIGTEAVVNAPPDGYTLLLVNAGNAINATLYEKLKYNLIRDIAPVAGIIRVPLVMQVNLSVPQDSSRVHRLQGRWAAAIGGDHRDPLGGAVGNPDRERVRQATRRAGGMRRSAQEHADRDCRTNLTKRSMQLSPIPR